MEWIYTMVMAPLLHVLGSAFSGYSKSFSSVVQNSDRFGSKDDINGQHTSTSEGHALAKRAFR
jgi:hypothetical protein